MQLEREELGDIRKRRGAEKTPSKRKREREDIEWDTKERWNAR